MVSLGDSAAGGSGSGMAGGGAGSGEHSKRSNSRGGSSVTVPSKKKKTLSQPPAVGPVLFDSSAEWWGGEKVQLPSVVSLIDSGCVQLLTPPSSQL